MPESDLEKELSIEIQHIQKAAFAYRAINHSLRTEMLKLLDKNTKMTVTDLYIRLRLEQSVASQHLAILRKQGIVFAKRDGKNIFYSVNYPRLQQLHEAAQLLIEGKATG
jgi:DNA-binding transcriptional ArsR family regulator